MGLINKNSFSPILPVAYYDMLESLRVGIQDQFAPDLFVKAYNAHKGNNPDSPTLKEALDGPYCEQFLDAMQQELKQLHQHKTWLPRIILREKLPSETQVIALTWVLKIKRQPNGELLKFKARLCYRGDLDNDPQPSFSPVVK